jgi:AcrR family transcriptional regulator
MPRIARTKAPSPARARILGAAHDLFYRDGIRATGIDRVIAAADVAKLTFYRHFPSKDALVLAFLGHRHESWMAWFEAALARRGGTLEALVPALGEWFKGRDFRGCAFLNSVAEYGGHDAQVRKLVARHKGDMAQAIEKLLPPGSATAAQADALALAVDGAIVRASYAASPKAALIPLALLVASLAKPEAAKLRA